VKSIVTYDGDVEEASAGDAVTITLEDEVDISRGDMLVGEERAPHVSRYFESRLVWMHAGALDPTKLYLLKHTTKTVRARVTAVHHRVDVNTLEHHPSGTLEMNDIASAEIETTLPLFFDPYRQIRGTGSFILIDPISNATVAAGMIERAIDDVTAARKASQADVRVTGEERESRSGHRPAAIAITTRKQGAELLERTLFDQGWNVALVDATKFGHDELKGAARGLKAAGTIAIFVLSHPSVALKAVYSNALIEADESVGSDLEFVSHLRSRLTEWNGDVVKGERQ
jgi:hypothetical protein